MAAFHRGTTETDSLSQTTARPSGALFPRTSCEAAKTQGAVTRSCTTNPEQRAWSWICHTHPDSAVPPRRDILMFGEGRSAPLDGAP
eukprot:CAMPEP_0180316566 /NCGR_PEP_ID=MMETSP0988-20121125/33331_1 /TAXON_ID=697907 /ORGANISM="non described non described, Strain CCMP2293" /LENGTH=86 /DNA_ID=CAMNT_0022301681 /DNA_START=454 /DNA_END=710 /DNA_ORIENTATION=+